jgi:hypothetical protein
MVTFDSWMLSWDSRSQPAAPEREHRDSVLLHASHQIYRQSAPIVICRPQNRDLSPEPTIPHVNIGLDGADPVTDLSDESDQDDEAFILVIDRNSNAFVHNQGAR